MRITADVVGRVIEIANFQHQLQIVLDAGGLHTEHDSIEIILPSPLDHLSY
jgi:hypothetical protein